MRIIDWNICYSGDIEKKIEYLKTFLTDESIVIMQEVRLYAYEYIKKMLQGKYNLVYSLDYRKPSKYDSEARRLGILIVVSNKFLIKESGVVERSLFPDRTAFASIEANGKIIKVLAAHSLTGCAYYRAKSIQFDSLSEFIDDYCPDIVGIDANEPRIDHYDVKQMDFYSNGYGAETFFNKMIDIGLVDSYVKHKGVCIYEQGSPLAKSYNVRTKGAVRYDFLFVRESYKINSCSYYYDDATKAGSDHAIIISDIEV